MSKNFKSELFFSTGGFFTIDRQGVTPPFVGNSVQIVLTAYLPQEKDDEHLAIELRFDRKIEPIFGQRINSCWGKPSLKYTGFRFVAIEFEAGSWREGFNMVYEYADKQFGILRSAVDARQKWLDEINAIQ